MPLFPFIFFLSRLLTFSANSLPLLNPFQNFITVHLLKVFHQPRLQYIMEEPANPPIRFDQTPYTRFYMCGSLTCRNHVLSMKDYLREEASLDAVICQNPVNVRANNIESRFLRYNQFLVDVFCNECNRKLGHRSVMVEAPNGVVQEGRFILFLKQMLYWNGNRVVYADTEQPIEDN